MDYVEATDVLMSKGVTLREVAKALGISRTFAAQARLDPSLEGHRKPPDGWPTSLASLAIQAAEARQESAVALADLARALSESG